MTASRAPDSAAPADRIDQAERRLRTSLRERVRRDRGTRALYSSDASLYREVPSLVVEPADIEELAAVVATCGELSVPLTVRGAGTSIAGNAIGAGVVVLTGALDRIIELDPDEAAGSVTAGGADGVLPAGPVVELDRLAGGTPAAHQVANVAAAACAALLTGVDVDAVREAALAHRPGPHRHRVVARRGDGVVFVDDSKATNVHAAGAALTTAGSIVWIAGGLAKGVDLSPLADALGAVHDAVLIGEAAEELARVCAAAGVASHRAATIEDAVVLASELARPDDTVLLAPACASFDQFRDHAERGDRFTAAARAASRAGGRA